MSITEVRGKNRAIERVAVDENNPKYKFYKYWRYGNGRAVQLTPDLAALVCGMRPEGFGGPDYTDGAGMMLFDDMDNLKNGEHVPLHQNEILGDLESGEARLAMKGGVWVWFVPAGARQEDGAPHPHAGTGFGISGVIEVPVGKDLKWPYRALLHESKRRKIIYQFEYDKSKGFRVSNSSEIMPDQMPSVPASLITDQMKAVAGDDMERFQWRFSGPGLGGGLPDGNDMLMPAMAKKEKDVKGKTNEFNAGAAGVMRWHAIDGEWRPVDFSPIAVSVSGCEQFWHEPSLVRTRDGALLFSARPRCGPYQNAVRLWKSQDGVAWKVVFDRLKVREESPVVINAAVDGSPYLALNPHHGMDEEKPYGYGRRKIVIRPLTPDMSGWEDEMVLQEQDDSTEERTIWYLDHPIGSHIRLGDKKWRNVLLYRSLLRGEQADGDASALRYGMYVNTIESDGPECPPWQF